MDGMHQSRTPVCACAERGIEPARVAYRRDKPAELDRVLRLESRLTLPSRTHSIDQSQEPVIKPSL
jgi:hypothetical protein